MISGPWLSNISRKVSLESSKVPHNGHWCSELLLVKSFICDKGDAWTSFSPVPLSFLPPCIHWFPIQRRERWYLLTPSTYSFHSIALGLFIFSSWKSLTACRILGPSPRMKPVPPLQQKHRVLTTGPPGKSVCLSLLGFFLLLILWMG